MLVQPSDISLRNITAVGSTAVLEYDWHREGRDLARSFGQPWDRKLSQHFIGSASGPRAERCVRLAQQCNPGVTSRWFAHVVSIETVDIRITAWASHIRTLNWCRFSNRIDRGIRHIEVKLCNTATRRPDGRSRGSFSNWRYTTIRKNSSTSCCASWSYDSTACDWTTSALVSRDSTIQYDLLVFCPYSLSSVGKTATYWRRRGSGATWTAPTDKSTYLGASITRNARSIETAGSSADSNLRAILQFAKQRVPLPEPVSRVLARGADLAPAPSTLSLAPRTRCERTWTPAWRSIASLGCLRQPQGEPSPLVRWGERSMPIEILADIRSLAVSAHASIAAAGGVGVLRHSLRSGRRRR